MWKQSLLVCPDLSDGTRATEIRLQPMPTPREQGEEEVRTGIQQSSGSGALQLFTRCQEAAAAAPPRALCFSSEGRK